jgi:predicted transglutaminase-like cysteine proteinase
MNRRQALAALAGVFATPAAASEFVPSPLAWTQFEREPNPSRRETIEIVNRLVNRGIMQASGKPDILDHWQIAPRAGWCHDYAITKRWLLLQMGFAASELILCECTVPDGQHHMVLLVDGLALDNLTEHIAPMRYPIVRYQTSNPDTWID